MRKRIVTDEQLGELLKSALHNEADHLEVSIRLKEQIEKEISNRRVCQVKCVNSFYTSFRNLVRYRVLTEIPVMVETCL